MSDLGRKTTLILASTSPRRIQLLTEAGVAFQSVDPKVDERPPSPRPPLQTAQWSAGQKAAAVAARYPGRVVIGADTLVVLDGRAYGKPSNRKEARAVLRALSGRTHLVYTAITVIDGRTGHHRRGFSRTFVTMRELSSSMILAYVRTGEAQDKAGAYAIQGEGQRLVRSINGPFDNVVGMPMKRLARLLQECGIRLTANLPNGAQHEIHEASRRAAARPYRRA
ncbi:MAG TPA: Maf family protein [Candidatus Dormibacteraeota bacterium]